MSGDVSRRHLAAKFDCRKLVLHMWLNGLTVAAQVVRIVIEQSNHAHRLKASRALRNAQKERGTHSAASGPHEAE
jgi:hypothetical protein